MIIQWERFSYATFPVMSFIGSQKKVILSYFQHPSCWVLQGPCRRVEFLDTRPNDHSSLESSDYDVSVLNGWIDKVDRPVYAEAVRIFHEDLVKYDVSPETCQACYEEAGLEVWGMNGWYQVKKRLEQTCRGPGPPAPVPLGVCVWRCGCTVVMMSGWEPVC